MTRLRIGLRIRPPLDNEPGAGGVPCVVATSSHKAVLRGRIGAVTDHGQFRGVDSQKRASSCSEKATNQSPFCRTASHDPKQKLVSSTHQDAHGTSREFTFDVVVPSDDNEFERFFAECVAPLVDSVTLDGISATLLLYGQTGAGKTHSMTQMFPLIRQRMAATLRDALHGVQFSALEVYGDVVRDLLPGSREEENHTETNITASSAHKRLKCPKGGLRVVDDGVGGAQTLGATMATIETITDAEWIMNFASSRRATAATNMNENSSRSHALYTFHVAGSVEDFRDRKAAFQSDSSIHSGRDAAHGCIKATMTLVDLAGSERNMKSGSTNVRFQESIGINSGLLALGNVIRGLVKAQRSDTGLSSSPLGPHSVFVPYRSSKLTRLLQHALGGNSRTLFMACVAPTAPNRDETCRTLEYSALASQVVNDPTQQLFTSPVVDAVEVDDREQAPEAHSALLADSDVDAENQLQQTPATVGPPERTLLFTDLARSLRKAEVRASLAERRVLELADALELAKKQPQCDRIEVRRSQAHPVETELVLLEEENLKLRSEQKNDQAILMESLQRQGRLEKDNLILMSKLEELSKLLGVALPTVEGAGSRISETPEFSPARRAATAPIGASPSTIHSIRSSTLGASPLVYEKPTEGQSARATVFGGLSPLSDDASTDKGHVDISTGPNTMVPQGQRQTTSVERKVSMESVSRKVGDADPKSMIQAETEWIPIAGPVDSSLQRHHSSQCGVVDSIPRRLFEMSPESDDTGSQSAAVCRANTVGPCPPGCTEPRRIEYDRSGRRSPKLGDFPGEAVAVAAAKMANLFEDDDNVRIAESLTFAKAHDTPQLAAECTSGSAVKICDAATSSEDDVVLPWHQGGMGRIGFPVVRNTPGRIGSW